MSQVDLDSIQTKLKVAIQNHQTLVAKLKSDPKNQIMRSKLRELQGEIMNLSERQKLVVQNLRKEIVQKQSPQVSIVKTLPVVQQYVSIAPQLSQLQTLSGQTPTLFTSAGTPVSFVTIPAAHLQKATAIALPLSTSICSVNTSVEKSTNNLPVNRGLSPPIRVPQYPITTSKPSILQNRGQCINKIVKIQDLNLQRKPADCVTKSLKKTSDKRQLSAEEKQKLQYMAALDLVTPETLKELQSKRTERKRRSTANPQFSYIEPEKKNRLNGYMLNSLVPAIKRGRGRPPKHGPSPNNSRPSTPSILSLNNAIKNSYLPSAINENEEDYLCAVCNGTGQVLQCNSCYKVFHMKCLTPPLTHVPTGYWCCSSCQSNGKVLSIKTSDSLAIINSYISKKTVKEDEKRKLQKRATDLLNEKKFLEAKTKELTENLTNQLKSNQELAEHNKNTKENMDNLANFIKMFQSSV